MAFGITGPGGPSRFGDPTVGDLEFTAVDAVGPVEWSTDKGSVSEINGPTTVLSPPNETTVVTLTAKDTGGGDPWPETTKQYLIEATLPVGPQWRVESDLGPNIEMSEPEQGPPRVRFLPDRTATWPLVMEFRSFQEYLSVRNFLIIHEGLPFWYADVALGEVQKVYQVSPLRRAAAGANHMLYSFRVKAFEFVFEGVAVGPFLGVELGEYGVSEYE